MRRLDAAYLPGAPPRFDQLFHLGLRDSDVYVPLELEAVVYVHPPDSYLTYTRIGSSFALERECLFVLNLFGWYREPHPDFDWFLEYGENPDFPGLRASRDVRHQFAGELSVVAGLLEVARASIASGCAITFC